MLANPRGTAPGLWLEDPRGRVAVLLPGVPREMEALVRDHVLPRLVQRSVTPRRVVRSRTVRTTGVAESALAERVGPIEESIAPLMSSSPAMLSDTGIEGKRNGTAGEVSSSTILSVQRGEAALPAWRQWVGSSCRVVRASQ